MRLQATLSRKRGIRRGRGALPRSPSSPATLCPQPVLEPSSRFSRGPAGPLKPRPFASEAELRRRIMAGELLDKELR